MKKWRLRKIRDWRIWCEKLWWTGVKRGGVIAVAKVVDVSVEMEENWQLSIHLGMICKTLKFWLAINVGFFHSLDNQKSWTNAASRSLFCDWQMPKSVWHVWLMKPKPRFSDVPRRQNKTENAFRSKTAMKIHILLLRHLLSTNRILISLMYEWFWWYSLQGLSVFGSLLFSVLLGLPG